MRSAPPSPHFKSQQSQIPAPHRNFQYQGELQVCRTIFLEVQFQRILRQEESMSIRWTTTATFLGMPLVAVAIGPDPVNSEVRGHARGFIAVGDFATGVVALGGLSR